MLNSVFVSCTTVVMQLFFSSLAGFALAKYEFRGKKFIMLLMLATVMIPSQVTMAPLYELIYRLGLIDTYPGLLIPAAVNVFGIFLFRQAILQVPDEMLHAARIDGASEFRIYWDVVMPVSRPMVGAFCLISFMAAWNNFLWPQIILHSKMRLTLPIGSKSTRRSTVATLWRADGGHVFEHLARYCFVSALTKRVRGRFDGGGGEGVTDKMELAAIANIFRLRALHLLGR